MNGLWVYELTEVMCKMLNLVCMCLFLEKRVQSYHLILKPKKTLEHWLKLENALNDKKIANLFMKNDYLTLQFISMYC